MVIFAILIGHVKLKIYTENAGLQSHTNEYAGKHDISFLKKKIIKIEDV